MRGTQKVQGQVVANQKRELRGADAGMSIPIPKHAEVDANMSIPIPKHAMSIPIPKQAEVDAGSPKKHMVDLEALSEDEQQKLQRLISAWTARTRSQRAQTSAQYQALQWRFLPLLAMSPTDMEEEFYNLRDQAGWSAATASSYWTAVVAAAVQVGESITPQMKSMGRVLTFLAKEEDPTRPTTPILATQLDELLQMLRPQEEMVAHVAFLLGQRVGDVLQLRRNRILDLGTEFVGLQFIKGKTTRRRAPFTLHIPKSHPLAQKLLDWSRRSPEISTGNEMMFTDVDGILQNLRLQLKKLNGDFSILSLRRGGLQHMASCGVPLDTMMHHSRHASVEMLMRYLSWGANYTGPARELFKLTQPAGPCTQSRSPQ